MARASSSVRQAVPLALFLQADQGGIQIVGPDAEFLPAVHTVQLLPQGLVRQIIEVQAADQVCSVCPVAVRLRRGPQALAQGDQVGGVDLMLPLVPAVHGSITSSLWRFRQGTG